jgi:GAF domain-containing protein
MNEPHRAGCQATPSEALTPSKPPLAESRFVTASSTLDGDLGLQDVLQRIVAWACALTAARYGAVGVIGKERRLAQFVHHGIDDDTVVAIGNLPMGHGILGLLIDDPRTLRLRDLRTHPRSCGFPAHHPPIRSVLGVPINVRGEIFGNA